MCTTIKWLLSYRKLAPDHEIDTVDCVETTTKTLYFSNKKRVSRKSEEY